MPVDTPAVRGNHAALGESRAGSGGCDFERPDAVIRERAKCDGLVGLHAHQLRRRWPELSALPVPVECLNTFTQPAQQLHPLALWAPFG